MSFALRAAVAGDIPELVAIDGVSNPSPWPAAAFEAELAREVSHVRVAAECDEVIGFIAYWVVADEVEVLNVAVSPRARRAGVGRALVAVAIAAAEASAAERVWLEVRRSNTPALSLYRSLGFVEAGVRRGYYASGEDAVLMARPSFKP